MAKDKNGNSKNGTFFKIAGFALTMAIVLSSVIMAWGDAKGRDLVLSEKLDTFIKTETKTTESIVENGTKKCKENQLAIVSMTKDIEFTADVVDDIQLEQRDIRTEQKAQYENIRKEQKAQYEYMRKEQHNLRTEQRLYYEEIIKRIDKKHDGPTS